MLNTFLQLQEDVSAGTSDVLWLAGVRETPDANIICQPLLKREARSLATDFLLNIGQGCGVHTSCNVGAKNTVDGKENQGEGLGSMKCLSTHDLTRKNAISLLEAMKRPGK